MSRIGTKPITIPENVEINIDETNFNVKGPKGENTVSLPRLIKLTKKENQLIVERVNETKESKSLHGTIRQLISNAIDGVVNEFQKKLELIGIGYRTSLEGNTLILNVGFTHSVKLELPEGITVKIEKNVITVSGYNKQVVGQFAANVRAVKKPEPYKGKGIRYQGEIVRMKAGKAAKSAA